MRKLAIHHATAALCAMTVLMTVTALKKMNIVVENEDISMCG